MGAATTGPLSTILALRMSLVPCNDSFTSQSSRIVRIGMMASALFSCSLIAMRKAASDVEYDTQAANIDDSVGVSELVAPGMSCVSEDGPSFRAE